MYLMERIVALCSGVSRSTIKDYFAGREIPGLCAFQHITTILQTNFEVIKSCTKLDGTQQEILQKYTFNFFLTFEKKPSMKAGLQIEQCRVEDLARELHHVVVQDPGVSSTGCINWYR